MGEIEETGPVENPREEIDKINMLTALLVTRAKARVIGIIMVKNPIILTAAAILQNGQHY